MYELLEVTLGGMVGNDTGHLGADGADLSRLGVRCLLGLLSVLLLGEANSEDSQVVAISGPHVNKGLDEGLPLADERA